jgi:hypothetical protein
MLTYYCWHCYATNDSPRGQCSNCGQEIARPAGAGYVDLLLWALHHPMAERQMIATRTLGRRREPCARRPLTELAVCADDPYLGAAALRSLIAIDGVGAHRELIKKLAGSESVIVKRAAQEALDLTAR